jgi:hypothetical protein
MADVAAWGAVLSIMMKLFPDKVNPKFLFFYIDKFVLEFVFDYQLN